MERENQRIAITKRLLKESLLRLLREKEMDKITISELCRDAGVNRATFYRHYEIPRDVLFDIQKDMYHKLLKEVPLPNGSEDIKPAIERLCSYMDQNQDLLRLLILNNSDADFANFVNEIYMEVWDAYGQIPLLKHLAQEDIRLLMLYCAGGSYFILRSWVMGSIRKSVPEMADYVYELLRRTDFDEVIAQLSLYKMQ